MCESTSASLTMRMVILAAVVLVALSTASGGSAAGERVVFVTSVTGTGDLGSWPDAGMATGTAAGDAICQARATAAGLANPSNFVAWLSDSSDDAYCRLHNLSGKKVTNCGQSTLPVAAGPWLHPNGIPFGEPIDQLLSPHGSSIPLSRSTSSQVLFLPSQLSTPRLRTMASLTPSELPAATGRVAPHNWPRPVPRQGRPKAGRIPSRQRHDDSPDLYWNPC